MRRIGEVHDVHEAADAAEALAEVVGPAVRREGALVAVAARQLDVGLQDRVATVRGVIDGEVRAVVLGDHEEVAPLVDQQGLVRVKRRGGVIQICGRLWMPWVGGIHHHDTLMLL